MNVDRLKEVLKLDRKSGHLYWKPRPIPGSWNARHAGRRAGADKGRGYRTVRVDGRAYFEHRVVYALATGKDPGLLSVDHINGDRSDNRPSNLQLATNAENVRKRHRMNANNTSGAHGVWWSKAAGKWEASIKVNGKKLYLGLFGSRAAARRVRKEAERLHFSAFAPAVNQRRSA